MIIITIAVLALFFVLLALSGALAPQKGTLSNGTINGTIVRSPIMPVCRVDQPCSAPASGINVTISSGARLFGAVTDSSGFYSVAVPAGSYHVLVQDTGISPARNYTKLVDVHPNETVIADFEIDTGIR